MTFKVTCPNGHKLLVDEKHAGKTVRCPKCSQSIQIPDLDFAEFDEPANDEFDLSSLQSIGETVEESREEEVDVILDWFTDSDPNAEPSRRKKSPGIEAERREEASSNRKTIAIAVIAICLVGLVADAAVAFSLYGMRPRMAAIPQPAIPKQNTPLPVHPRPVEQINSVPEVPTATPSPPIRFEEGVTAHPVKKAAKGQQTVLDFPEPIGEAVVAGSGRHLIVTLPKSSEVVVIDVAAQMVVKRIPQEQGHILVAGGETTFVVCLPAKKTISRYDLTTFECERTEPCDEFSSIAMGCSSQGPVIGIAPGTTFIDLETLKGVTRNEPLGVKIHARAETRVQASANGTLFCGLGNSRPQSLFSYHRMGQTFERFYHGQIDTDYALPSANGESVYTELLRFGPHLEIPFPPLPGSDFVPAATGDFFLTLEHRHVTGEPPTYQNLQVHHPSRPAALCAVPDFEFSNEIQEGMPEFWNRDNRLFWLPSADSIIAIPSPDDRVLFHRFSLKAELQRSGGDYFYIGSSPPAGFTRGKEYQYQIGLLSRDTAARYELLSGPPGLKVSPQGLVQWKVPADFPSKETSASIEIRNSAGAKIAHPVRLVRNVNDAKQLENVPSTKVTGGQVAASTDGRTNSEQKPSDPRPVTVNLTTPLKQVQTVSSDRLLIASTGKEIALIDVANRKIRKSIPLKSDDAFVVGGETKLVVYQKALGTLSRYDLETGTEELTVNCRPYNGLAMGTSSEGPLIGFGQQLDLISLETLEPETIQFGSEWDAAMSKQPIIAMSAVADGKFFAGHTAPNSLLRLTLEHVGEIWIGTFEQFREPDTYTRGLHHLVAPSIRSDGKSTVFNFANPAGTEQYIPTDTGNLFFILDVNAVKQEIENVRVYTAAERHFVASFRTAPRNAPPATQPNESDKPQFPIDQRIRILPATKALIVVSSDGMRIQIQTMDLLYAIRKSPTALVRVTSFAPEAVDKGSQLTHQFEVVSTNPIVSYEMINGPPGMSVLDEGLLTWNVPANWSDTEIEVTIGIRDSQGTFVVQSFPWKARSNVSAPSKQGRPPIVARWRPGAGAAADKSQ